MVGYGDQHVRFKASGLKMRRSILTLPSAWKFVPMSEIAFEVSLPRRRAAARDSALCRGIVLACRPQKSAKNRYEVDLVLTQVPRSHLALFDEVRPHLPLCLEINCSECRWHRMGLSNTRGDCKSIQEFKQQASVAR